MPALFPAYSAGNYRRLPPELIRVVDGRKPSGFRAGRQLVTCLDGECFRSRDVTLTLSGKKLRFFAPPGSDPNAAAPSPGLENSS